MVLILWRIGTGQPAEEFTATLLGGFLASVAGALLVTAVLTLVAFVASYLYFAPGGRSGSPEEQLLNKNDDD